MIDDQDSRSRGVTRLRLQLRRDKRAQVKSLIITAKKTALNIRLLDDTVIHTKKKYKANKLIDFTCHKVFLEGVAVIKKR